MDLPLLRRPILLIELSDHLHEQLLLLDIALMWLVIAALIFIAIVLIDALDLVLLSL